MWTHKSHEELVEAGYVWKGYGTCRERSCGKKILFYRTPNGKHMPIDQETFEPHFTSCEAVLRKRREKADDAASPRGIHIVR